MADKTAIEWCDATWNPVVGCSIVSKGCTNCYAMKMAARLEAMGQPIYRGMTAPSKTGPVWTGAVRLNPAVLAKPLSWRRPRRIFVNSMSDLFHEALPDEAIDKVFAVMALAPQHTFQVLTKRPARMRDYLRVRAGDWMVVLPDAHAAGTLPITKNDVERAFGRSAKFSYDPPTPTWPLPNVWLGVSVEDQATADARIPILLDTPAALRFISAEPLLGPVDLTYLDTGRQPQEYEAERIDALRGGVAWESDGTIVARPSVGNIDWVIAGGESGPDARPMHPDWARSLRDQCAAAGVPYFFKQHGEWAPICAMSEAALDACYRPNVKAAPGEDQRAIDDVHGRRRIVDATVLHADGSRHDHLEPGAFAQGSAAMTMFAIGKSAAGALLDGREHREFPR